MIKSTRQQALENGQKYYYTGAPCVRGHVARRRVDSARCMECAKEDQKANYYAATGRDGVTSITVQVPVGQEDIVRELATALMKERS